MNKLFSFIQTVRYRKNGKCKNIPLRELPSEEERIFFLFK
jgi:hypothetical protein